MSTLQLPFEQRACFIAGQAKSGTTLLVSLLDGHPELIVFPQETAYFPTVLTKYGKAGRRAQFDYLTKQSFAKILFGGQARWGKHDYKDFPQQKFLETFERAAFAKENQERDLLVLMIESYARTLGISLDRVIRWVEKTPANRNYIMSIFDRFPRAKLLVTMRDPRAILAAQIALEKSRQRKTFSVYYVIAHWLVAAKLAKRVQLGGVPGFVVPYEQVVREPSIVMEKVCDYLEIKFDPNVVLQPTKVGQLWSGNSAASVSFSRISAEPVSRWERELTEEEIGWVEWHCADLMPEFGYEPRLSRPSLKNWFKPLRGERPREYLKSRVYSIRDRLKR
jgi:Sulfotransferase family